MRRLSILTVLALLVAGAAYWQLSRTPKRFAPVAEGLYRSGEVSPRQLEHLTRQHGLKTVLSLLNPAADESRAEIAAAEKLGLAWLNIPLTGDGASTPADRDRIRAIVLDPSHRPMLVHCSAGANRTGLAIGMYRIHAEGWTYERVLEEMKQFDFEDEPHHENLRQALRNEVTLRDRPAGGAAASRPAP
jgi:protein tyrosine/serine phosphatase